MMVLFSRDANYEQSLDLLDSLRARVTDERGRDILTGAAFHLIAQWRESQETRNK